MSLPHLAERELIKRYLSGDEFAFEILLKRYQNAIFGRIMSMVKDEELADDLFQEAMFKAIKTIKCGKYNEEGKFLPWINRIAHNLVIDHFRNSKKMYFVRQTEEYDVFAHLDLQAESLESKTEFDSTLDDIRKLIAYLPIEQREVIILRIYFNMTFREIADRCGINVNTALGRMRYAILKLQKLADKKGVVFSVN